MARRGLVMVVWAATGLVACTGADDATNHQGTDDAGTTGTTAGTSSGSGAPGSSSGEVADGSSGTSSTGVPSESTGTPDPICGDGNIDLALGEECDDGENNADTAACKSDCTAAFCGDNFVQAGVEECDDANAINNDGCTDRCIVLESCGDLIVQPPEECDLGKANADNAACKSDCQFNVCGDGDVQTGVEVCDDGNQEDNDVCSTLCMPPACGDGLVQSVNAELCDDGDLVDGDECNSDCFSAGLWTVTENGPASNNDAAFDAAVDSLNNVIVVGEIFDTVQGANLWVRSYNGNGQVNWTDVYHNVTSDNAYGVVVAPNDDIFVAGSSFTASNGRDTWVRQYAPDGTPGPIFTENGDANGADEAFGIAMDPNGDLLVVGYVTSVGSGRDIWIRKYTTAGVPVWTRTVTSAASFLDEGHGVAADAEGNVVVTGYIWAGTEGRDIWVRKYDGDGTEQWTDTVGGSDSTNDEGNGIATDADGNVVVTGFIDNGPNGRDVWIRKYDPMGLELWTQTYNAPQNGTDNGEDVEVDTDGNIIVGGSTFRGTQQDNVWVAKFDPDGAALWTMEYNNSAAFLSDAAHGVAVDSEDNITVVGFETRSDIGEARNIWIRYVLQ